MNLDEETFLTAFLDGELDPKQHRRAKSALSDPKLAEHLRALASVRDMVSGLPRPPSPVDVSTMVVARIEAKRASRPFGLRLRLAPDGSAASRGARLGGFAAVAAALVVAVVVGFRGPAPNQPRTPALISNHPIVSPVVERSRPVVVASTNTSPDRLLDTPPGREERQGDQDRERVRRLLDSKNLHKAIYVTDVIGGDASRRVGELLEKSPRRYATFSKLTVTHEILFDPKHPGRATVFVVVMDEGELRRLQDRLSESFPDRYEEGTPRPEFVTQLADVGQIAVLPGIPVADVFFPHEGPQPALRTETPKSQRVPLSEYFAEHPGLDPLHDFDHYQAESAVQASNADEPTPAQERSGPHPSLLNRPDPEPVADKRPARVVSPASVVLVCVTTPT